MNRPKRWLAAAALGASALFGFPQTALSRSSTKVQWTRIDVPEGKDSARLAKLLKSLLTQAAKKADFGKLKSVKLSARIVSFSSVEKGDVLQVSCTIGGKLEGGPGARSHISFGGSPKERAQLEKQVLSMVANGLVTRLAEMAKNKTEREEAAKKKAEEEAADEDSGE